MDFDGVWEILDSTIPPEISHYRAGNHPGLGWWLKTAVPKNTNLSNAWQTLATNHPTVVQMVHVAYNWQGAEIQSALSVWIRDNQDLDLDHINGQWHYVIRPFDESVNVWGHRLNQNLRTWQRRKHKTKLDEDNWHKLKSVAQMLQTWTSNQQAQIKRKGLKLVVDNQKDSGHSAN
jgi:hypothetical protein